MKAFTIIFFLLICLSPNVFSQNIIELDDNSSEISANLKEYIYVYKDDSQQLTFNDIAAPDFQNNFKLQEKKTMIFGFTESHVWLRFQLRNSSNSFYPWFFEISYAPLDSVILYHQSAENTDNNWQQLLAGDQIPIDQWPVFHKNAVFPIRHSNDEIHTYFIRIKTKGSIQLPISLTDYETFQKNTNSENLIFGFYYGILLVMFLYNFLLFIAIRRVSYLYYCLYILAFLVGQLALLGHGFQYVWGNNLWFSSIALPLGLSIGIFFSIQFAMSFLYTKQKTPIWHKILLGYASLSVLFILAALFLDYNISIKITSLGTFVLTFLLLSVGTIAFLKGQKAALFYVIAWSLLLIGLMFALLVAAGVLPRTFFFTYAPSFGGAAEVILLSLGLADMINQYRADKEKAQANSLKQVQENERIVREQNTILEKKVAERTEEIELQNQEIVTQNEELQQQQEEIMSQRDFIQERNARLSEINLQVKSSINAAKAIQNAILPLQEKIETLFSDHFILYRPKDIVSGDFYWVEELGNKTIVAAFDCTGHGVPGAFMSLVGNTQIDKIVRIAKISDPAEILTHLHTEVRNFLRQDDTDNEHGMDASLAVVEKLENRQVKITFCGAKRPLYYLEKGENLQVIKGDRKSIGGRQNKEKPFTNKEIILAEGSSIYLGSDGLEDQNDVARKKIGSIQLFNFLSEIKELPMNEQKQHLDKFLDRHMEDTVQRDDMLLLGFVV